jgi:hypothetical protein
MNLESTSSTSAPLVVFIADRSHLKVYQVQRAGEQTDGLRLVSTQDFHRINQEFAGPDSAFPPTSSESDDRFGSEQMLMEAALEIRVCQRMADEIAGLLKDFGFPQWSFAAPSEINGGILDELEPVFRQTLSQSLALDLVEVAPSDLLSHFEKAN